MIRLLADRAAASAIFRTALISGIAAAAVLGLAGCSNSSSQTNQLVAPVIVDLAGINGKQVTVSLNNVVDLKAGNTNVTAWNGTVQDGSIASWVPGKKDGSAEFNPGLKPLKEGKTQVTVTNTADKSSQTFTLSVTK